MHHQYSNLIGRLTGISNHVSPLYPISPVPLSKNEASAKVIYDPTVKMSTVSTPKNVPGVTGAFYSEKVRIKQAIFQRNDGLPVHLKGGAMDRILLGVTAGLCVIGVGMTLKLIYELSFPKKA